MHPNDVSQMFVSPNDSRDNFENASVSNEVSALTNDFNDSISSQHATSNDTNLASRKNNISVSSIVDIPAQN